MAYAFTRSSSQYLSAGAAAQGVPMTLSAWFYAATLPGSMCILSVGQANATHRHRMSVNVSGAFSVQSSGFSTGTTAANGTSSTANGAVSAGQWYHGAATVETANRVAYLNGTAATANTTSLGSFNTFSYTHVGSQFSTTLVDYLDGRVGEVGIWSAVLTADEIASLAKGFACNKVRPQSLVFYAPLVRNLVDVRGGLAITNNNTATVSDNPAIFY